jgi:APA family basic amino acid/polyamine antiporter
VYSGRYDQLLTYVVLVSWLFYAAGACAVFVLRRRGERGERALPRPPSLGHPLAPAGFVLAAVALLVASLAGDPRDAAIGVALTLAGLPAYLLWHNRGSRDHATRRGDGEPGADGPPGP